MKSWQQTPFCTGCAEGTEEEEPARDGEAAQLGTAAAEPGFERGFEPGFAPEQPTPAGQRCLLRQRNSSAFCCKILQLARRVH